MRAIAGFVAALLVGCGGPEYLRVETTDGREVTGRVVEDGDPLRLDTGPAETSLARDQVKATSEVSRGRWSLAAGTACLEAGKRDDGLRHLGRALNDPDRAVVDEARRRLDAALKPPKADASPRIVGKQAPEPQGEEPPAGEVRIVGSEKPDKPPGPDPAGADPEAVKQLEEEIKKDRRIGTKGTGEETIPLDPSRAAPVPELDRFKLGSPPEEVKRALGSDMLIELGDLNLEYIKRGMTFHYTGKRLAGLTVVLVVGPGQDDTNDPYTGSVFGQLGRGATLRELEALIGAPVAGGRDAKTGERRYRWEGWSVRVRPVGPASEEIASFHFSRG